MATKAPENEAFHPSFRQKSRKTEGRSARSTQKSGTIPGTLSLAIPEKISVPPGTMPGTKAPYRSAFRPFPFLRKGRTERAGTKASQNPIRAADKRLKITTERARRRAGISARRLELFLRGRSPSDSASKSLRRLILRQALV